MLFPAVLMGLSCAGGCKLRRGTAFANERNKKASQKTWDTFIFFILV